MLPGDELIQACRIDSKDIVHELGRIMRKCADKTTVRVVRASRLSQRTNC